MMNSCPTSYTHHIRASCVRDAAIRFYNGDTNTSEGADNSKTKSESKLKLTNSIPELAGTTCTDTTVLLGTTIRTYNG